MSRWNAWADESERGVPICSQEPGVPALWRSALRSTSRPQQYEKDTS